MCKVAENSNETLESHTTNHLPMKLDYRSYKFVPQDNGGLANLHPYKYILLVQVVFEEVYQDIKRKYWHNFILSLEDGIFYETQIPEDIREI